MRKLKELRPGEVFKFAGTEWIKLDDLEDGCLSITKEEVTSAAFSEAGKNDYSYASIGDLLNIKIFNTFIENGAKPEDFINFSRNLIADDGTKEYINVLDTISLITCEEYRKYREFITPCKNNWWTLTPVSSQDKNEEVKTIAPMGVITEAYAKLKAFAVRPVCNINKEKEVEEMPVTEKIKKWFKDRNLDRADPKSQMLKLMEETGELAEGIAKNRPDQIKDSIGDIYVVLTGLSIQLGYNIEECIEAAYEEIKDRKGKMIDGVFVKESDL